jgi:hypothetical protein
LILDFGISTADFEIVLLHLEMEQTEQVLFEFNSMACSAADGMFGIKLNFVNSNILLIQVQTISYICTL